MQRVAAFLKEDRAKKQALGRVEVRRSGYTFRIHGKFAARGPCRKTKAEAQKDGEAVAKAGDGEATQKMLKDLRAKMLRAEGKHLIEERSLGYVKKQSNNT